MRMLIGIVVMVWLVSGTVAAAHRGWFGDEVAMNCRNGASTALTVLAGPINYAGLDPTVQCST